MDFFTKNKMLFWCVAILVILNIATLGTFWFKQNTPRPSIKQDQEGSGQKLMEERLQLSESQAEKFRQIRNEHFQRTRPLQDEMHKIRMELLDETFAPERNDEKIDQLFSELEDLQIQFEKNLYKHFEDLKEACNEEQVGQLKEMLRDLIESTRPRDPRHGERRRGGDMERGHRPPPLRDM